MGIQGLLPLLKDVQTPINVSRYEGQTLGIDGYVWLHRGAYGCADKLVAGESTTQYTNYAMYRIRMLRHHGITPYVVFDGDRLPSKAGTEEEREARRRENLTRAKELIKGEKKGSAFEVFARCIDITPEMAYQLIKCLKAEGVAYVVAPYEADAQLAYLEKTGIIDAVVTEDSDLLVFGCRKVLFKMDSNGDCIEISSSRLTACKTLSFAGWTTDLFRQMAILSGCDYLPSISGLGLKNAHRLLQRYKTVKRVLQAVRLEGKMRIPPDYQSKFEQAEKTFLYQRVWCPKAAELTTLSALEAEEAAMDYIGPEIPREEARGIACGEIDPISRLPMVDIAKGFQPGFKRPKVLSSSLTPALRRTSSKKAAKATLLQGQTTLLNFGKRSAGSRTSKTVSLQTVQRAQQPLGVRDVNIIRSFAGPSTPIKSPFFGGQRKSTPPSKAITTSQAIDEGAEEDIAMLTKPPNASQSHISGMGDYFCELDGADSRLLLSEGEGEDVPAFNALATLADEVKGEEEEAFEWAVRDCESDVSSDDAHTTPKRGSGWQEMSSRSSAFSSPSTDLGEEGVTSTKGTMRQSKKAGIVPHDPGTVEADVLSASSMGDVTPSPVQDREVKEDSPCLFFDTDVAHLTSGNFQHGDRVGFKRALREEDSEAIGEEQEEGDPIVPSQVDESTSLWAKYRNQLQDRQSESATPLRPRSVLRTPSNRPLRLYAFHSSAENSPFGSIASSSTTTRISEPSAQRALSFQHHKNDADNILSPRTWALPSVAASGLKRMKVQSPAHSTPPPKLTTSRSLSVLPLSTRPANQSDEGHHNSSLSAFRYSESPGTTKKSLSMGTSPVPAESGRRKGGSFGAISRTKDVALEGKKQQRGVLSFEVASEAKGMKEGRSSTGRPSLDRFKFRSL